MGPKDKEEEVHTAVLALTNATTEDVALGFF